MTPLALLALGAPLATFVSLALLPQGKSARVGLMAAVLILALLWLRSDQTDAAQRLILSLFLGAVSLAALMQVLRAAFPATAPRAAYPGLVILTALAGLSFLLTQIGA
jgi:hypothetical protein